MDNIRLDILAVGSLVRIRNEVKEAHSTSALIRTPDMNIVVDTSSAYLRPAVISSLKALKVLPDEVNATVLTHAHSDHTENTDIFRRSEIFVRYEEAFEGGTKVAADIELCRGVRLVHTPGHTQGSMSVFVDSERRYAITGDAIPLEDNYRKRVPPAHNVNAEAAMESIKSITDYADVVIPGHGFPFLRCFEG
jgi:glyoxylase-like metal-dependent hydrolase (beta-lactamase superfamily II)